MEFLTSLLQSGLALATPVLLVALGEIVSERAGVLNIGVEGMMLTGALAGVVGSFLTGNPWLGLLTAIGAGIVMSTLFAALAVGVHADQVLVGTGINIFALGVTGVARREIFGVRGETLRVATLPAWKIPGLDSLPALGRIIFSQDAVVYFTLVATVFLAYWLFRTPSGLGLRASGENPEAADSAGVHVGRTRWQALVTGGAFCGLAGGHLALGLSNTFVEGMTTGRGFIALAIVIVSRWNPLGAFAVALFFGTASALQYRVQALGELFGAHIPYQFLLMLPYILTLIVAALWSRRGGAPAALGHAYERS